MRTLEEKVNEVMALIKFANIPPTSLLEISEKIGSLLKEQDRDTRHAIAEKLMQSSSPTKMANGDLSDVIEANKAEGIAINTKAF